MMMNAFTPKPSPGTQPKGNLMQVHGRIGILLYFPVKDWVSRYQFQNPLDELEIWFGSGLLQKEFIVRGSDEAVKAFHEWAQGLDKRWARLSLTEDDK